MARMRWICSMPRLVTACHRREQRYPPGHVPQHSHARGHLIYASEGVLLVESPRAMAGSPTTAVWLRPGMLHRITATTAVRPLACS
jgi:hypothetical protein